MQSRSSSEPREEELAALADGSLAPERRSAVEAMLADSPELAAALEEQRRIVAAMQSAAASVDAPSGLRARVEAERRPRPRRRFVWAGGVALGAAAAVALVVVLLLPAGAGGPSVAEAAVLAARPATGPAPAAASPTLLAHDVEGVSFPNWAAKFGWKATGVRVDTIAGRQATTVFYEKGGKRIGYTIMAGSKLKWPGDAAVTSRGPTDFRLLTVNGRTVVTWLRDGHTCILSGADLDSSKLVKLAAWNGKGTVSF